LTQANALSLTAAKFPINTLEAKQLPVRNMKHVWFDQIRLVFPILEDNPIDSFLLTNQSTYG
jgi:hypothetical protein